MRNPVALQIYRKWPASLGLRQNWFISSFAFTAMSADILPPWPCCVPRGKAGGSLQGATHRGSLEMRCHTVTAASSFSAIKLLCNSALFLGFVFIIFIFIFIFVNYCCRKALRHSKKKGIGGLGIVSLCL